MYERSHNGSQQPPPTDLDLTLLRGPRDRRRSRRKLTNTAIALAFLVPAISLGFASASAFIFARNSLPQLSFHASQQLAAAATTFRQFLPDGMRNIYCRFVN